MLKDFLTINRIYQGRIGTFGVLQDFDNIPFAVTAELPWKDNNPSVSCIPSDIYICRKFNSPKYGWCYRVEDVPGRSYILFHKGNVPIIDSEGCILVAESFDTLDGKHAVLQSSKGYNQFLEKLKGVGEFKIKINNLWSF